MRARACDRTEGPPWTKGAGQPATTGAGGTELRATGREGDKKAATQADNAARMLVLSGNVPGP